MSMRFRILPAKGMERNKWHEIAKEFGMPARRDDKVIAALFRGGATQQRVKEEARCVSYCVTGPKWLGEKSGRRLKSRGSNLIFGLCLSEPVDGHFEAISQAGFRFPFKDILGPGGIRPSYPGIILG